MSTVSENEIVPRVLPRGKNAASREVVRSSQRLRMLEAMTDLAAKQGYPSVTIGEIVGSAGVAKPTFYEHFTDKEACFVALYEQTVDAVVHALADALDPNALVEERVCAGVRAFLRFVAENDARARILQIESMKIGPFAASRVSEAHRRFAGLYIASREVVRAISPDVPPISMTRGLAIVGAVNEPVTVMLREMPAERVLDIEDELIAVVRALALTP